MEQCQRFEALNHIFNKNIDHLTFTPPLFQDHVSFSFFVLLTIFMVMGTPSGALQYILNSKGNQRMYKDFKLFDILNGYGQAQMSQN